MTSGIRYRANMPKEQKAEALRWLEQQLGKPGFRAQWIALDYTIHFRKSEDRTLFYLKWPK